MSVDFRKELKNRPMRRILVKVGSSGLVDENSQISLQKIRKLTIDISCLKSLGIEVILVSSGAISAGSSFFKSYDTQKNNISMAQACAAVGQPILMQHYQKELKKQGFNCAQVLLTHEDIKNRKRYLNARNTLLKLLKQDVLPILNENDSVSFDEITMGDNDQLAAMVAVMLEVDLLLVLTATDGLFTKDPRKKGATHISEVNFNQALKDIKLQSKTQPGRGGMVMKLQAVKNFSTLGGPVIISSHSTTKPILRALYKQKGTFFHPNQKLSKRKRKSWVFSSRKPGVRIVVDQGASSALQKNSSLLPIGIKSVQGYFQRGDAVELVHKGKVIGIGLVEYSDKEVKALAGHKSTEIKKILGYFHTNVIVHRDNLFTGDLNI